LIADNASGPETDEVIQKLMSLDGRIKCLKHSINVGIARNFQAALMQTTTPYVCFLPDDDFYAPSFFEQNLPPFTHYPALGFSGGGGVLFIDESRTVRSPVTAPGASTFTTGYYPAPKALLAHFRSSLGIQLPSILFKTQLLQEIGGFDIRLGCCIDLDLIAKMTARFPVYVQMEGPFYFYYQNSESISRTFDLSWQEKEALWLHENTRAIPLGHQERAELDLWFKEWNIRIYSKLYGQFYSAKEFDKAATYAEKLSSLTGSLRWRSRKTHTSLYYRLPFLLPLYEKLKAAERALRRRGKPKQERPPELKLEYQIHPETETWKAFSLKLEND
jgi:glycosyltransferase involved in cell wall biosynthesis